MTVKVEKMFETHDGVKYRVVVRETNQFFYLAESYDKDYCDFIARMFRRALKKHDERRSK